MEYSAESSNISRNGSVTEDLVPMDFAWIMEPHTRASVQMEQQV